MSRKLSFLALAAVLLFSAFTSANGEATSAFISGVTRDSGGKPLGQVVVNAYDVQGKTDHTVTSGPNGAYTVAGLAPGEYLLTATAPGLASSPPVSIVVTDRQSSYTDLYLDKVAGATQAAPAPTNVSAAAKPGFWKRFGDAYWSDWHPSASTDPTAAYRGYPAPVSNPPYPFTIWPMGGTVNIGYPGATQYPLTTALQTGPHGDWWKKANIQMYGWADLGMNISSSNHGPYPNAPAAYDQLANSFTLDQLTLYIERVPDTVQTDHFDWGFRLTNLYGFDYRFTTARGYFSQQLLNNPQPNGTIGNKYGYDPVMAYVDLYFPHVGDGMDVRIGRYISLPDIEAQLAPNNYTYTHSLLYTYDCYTQTGANATIKWSNHWTTQFGISGGCEASPWAPNAKVTANACLNYAWTEGMNDIYICANSINDSKYSYNNLAAYYLTWYHKFGQSKWHVDWETWYQYMKDTPNVLNPAATPLLTTNSNGAYCKYSTELTCFAPEWATLVYLNRQISKKDFISFRDEYFDDIKGQRTGFKTKYTETGIAWNHWIGSTIVLRPEVRYEHAFDATAYDTGTKKSQWMFAADVIFFY
jgi:Putative beta-barrel porin-2, OmpL-like. bbp2/Carboxypeptidase regulatory-like domain